MRVICKLIWSTQRYLVGAVRRWVLCEMRIYVWARRMVVACAVRVGWNIGTGLVGIAGGEVVWERGCKRCGILHS